MFIDFVVLKVTAATIVFTQFINQIQKVSHALRFAK